MSTPLMNQLIDATTQERRRLEEPRNRSRYFLFGKVDERQDGHGYAVTLEHVPDRVHREASWAIRRNIPSLFKVGDIFVSGTIEAAPRGVTVAFSAHEMARLNLDVAAIRRSADIGLDYVMDSRDLMDHLSAFLASRRTMPNRFLTRLVEDSHPTPMQPITTPEAFADLNVSQNAAVSKALSQRVTFFWGPPGTGKTKTMAALAATLVHRRKRVLLTALSNTALDQLLSAACERLGSALGNYSVARLGSTTDQSCRRFTRDAFDRGHFPGHRGSTRWSEHAKHAALVAANFAVLALPRAAKPEFVDCVIADEVSMANIPSLAVASFYANTGMVVGGDPLQLPPIFPEDAEEPNEWFRANIFERAGVTTRDDMRAAFLDTQYRMQPEIGTLVSQMFYDGALQTGTAPAARLNVFDSRVLFVNSPGPVTLVGDPSLGGEEQRRFNETHAQTAASAVVRALKHGIPARDIGVIAPYNAQVVKILHKLRALSQAHAMNPEGVKVSTIHSFQGQEKLLIVADFTDDSVRPTALTAKVELINVALSRAKEQLIIIGNRDYLLDPHYFSRDKIELFERMLAGAHTMERRSLE